VSHYVTPGTALDDEAYARATSTYLEDRVLPMLPERLSNDLCSLREKEDRLAMTVMMQIDSSGKPQGCEIFESVIRVDHRMTYDDVLAIIEGDTALSEKYADFVDHFHTMNKLARKLRARRMAHGSLDFSFPEARAIFDSEGEVVDIVLQRQTLAHELIEEFMLMANQAVGLHVTDTGAPMIYRIHETPADDRIEKFREFVASIGYQLGEKNAATPKGLQKVSRQAKGKPEENLINYLMLRALKMARYSPENLGHFGLACECYTHFTSPIRRYPDLVAHRILKALASGGAKLVAEEYSERLEKIAEHCSGRERKSIEAERESLETKQLFFMSDKIGGEFIGRITGVHSYGLFIELVDYLVEGLIHISSLDDDYYIFMEEKHCLLGEHAGKSFRLGDELKVRVVKIDLDRKRMDFVVADVEPKAKRGGKQPTKPGSKPPAKRRRGRRRR
jgi:ribonuclease R